MCVPSKFLCSRPYPLVMVLGGETFEGELGWILHEWGQCPYENRKKAHFLFLLSAWNMHDLRDGYTDKLNTKISNGEIALKITVLMLRHSPLSAIILSLPSNDKEGLKSFSQFLCFT